MKETKKSNRVNKAESSKSNNKGGDELVAIAMALYSYFGEQHDDENDRMTINHVIPSTSQWCSKIFNMRNIR